MSAELREAIASAPMFDGSDSKHMDFLAAHQNVACLARYWLTK